MKNVFIDIFVHFQLFVKISLKIYVLRNDKKINLFTSSNTITTLHYLLKKSYEKKKLDPH